MPGAITPIRALPCPPVPTRRGGPIASFRTLRRNPIELWGEAAYSEKTVVTRMFGRKQVLLNDPDGIRHVLLTNTENYQRGTPSRRILGPVLGKGLLLSEGDHWRHQRRTITPALAPRSIPILIRHVAAAADHAESVIDAARGAPVELLSHMRDLSVGIAARSMFSLEIAQFGEELRTKLLDYNAHYAVVSLLDLVLPYGVTSPMDRRRARFRAQWIGLLDRIIEARRAQPSRPDAPRDLLELLESARDPETGEGFNPAQLRDQVATMILAAQETTGMALFWSCYLAAIMPEQQEAIAAEAAGADLSPDSPGVLRALPRTRAHIEESLRLYPPAFLMTRQALAPDTVVGIAVPRGATVSISPWVLHRNRALWDRADRFDPERFMPGAPPPDKYAYMPFGAGPRVCVGAQFALTETITVVGRLLRRYRIALDGSGDVVPRGRVTTQPDRPVYFRFTPRR